MTTGKDKKVPFPVMLRGRHGVGKSCVVYQLADKVAWEPKKKAVVVRQPDSDLPGYDVIERRASQMTEGDLIGLPVIDGERTRFNPPDWLKEACERPVIIFLDEIDRAVTEVRQGFFELTDSRKIHGQFLHPGTLIFSAVNGGVHGSQYSVAEMDPAELDRWTVFDVDPSVEDWLTWAQDNVHQVIIDFIRAGNHVHLEHKGDFEPNKVYPSRRSWHRLSDTLKPTGFLDKAKDTVGEVFSISEGFIGLEASVAFQDFCSKYDAQVTIEDLLDNGKFNLVKKWKINDHTAMVDKFIAEGLFKTALSDDRCRNLAKYCTIMPNEVTMKLWSALAGEASGDVQAQKNLSRVHTAKLFANGDVRLKDDDCSDLTKKKVAFETLGIRVATSLAGEKKE